MKNNEIQENNNVGAWVMFALSMLYMVSPIDIIPDIPVVGWFDDFFIAATGTLNLVEKTCEDSTAWLSHIAKILKWLTIIVGVIAILLVLLLGTVIVKLFT